MYDTEKQLKILKSLTTFGCGDIDCTTCPISTNSELCTIISTIHANLPITKEDLSQITKNGCGSIDCNDCPIDPDSKLCTLISNYDM